MLILLIRHADAGARDANRWPDDSLRPLTDRGKRRHRQVAQRVKRRDCTPTLLLASPWLRAFESAEIVARETKCAAPVACTALAEPPRLRSLAIAAGRVPAEGIVALVGHEPWLSELAALLLTGAAGGLAIDLPKSGVIGLEAAGFKPGGATLRFLWRPKGA